MTPRIYMDHAATTPLDPRVLAAMMPFFQERFGNAASAGHSYGWEAEAAVTHASEQVAALIGAQPKDILWTSGATESINLALKGVAAAYKPKGRHIVSCATEHSAVLDCLEHLRQEGFTITLLPVDSEGGIDPETLRGAIGADTFLVSFMAGNNETGVMHPLAAIGAIARERGCLLHVDAAQAFGKAPLDVEAMNIDLMSLSAHKLYGPKGIGALYLRRRNPRVRLEAQMHGGGHQGGLRSGTLNVPGIVGLGEAARLASELMAEESARLLALRRRLEDGIRQGLPDVIVNGRRRERLPHIASLCFPGVEAAELMLALRGIALSSGAACASSRPGPSHVLLAMGVGRDLAHRVLRFSLGRTSSDEEVEEVIGRVIEAVRRLRKTHSLRA
jgi:cysteine desulfurase